MTFDKADKDLTQPLALQRLEIYLRPENGLRPIAVVRIGEKFRYAQRAVTKEYPD